MISNVIALAVRNNFSLALWRLPANNTHRLIISRKLTWLKQHEPLETLPAGFLFAPFDHSLDRIFLSADFSFSFENGVLKRPASETDVASVSWLQSELSDNLLHDNAFYKIAFSQSEMEKGEFISLIGEAIREIEELQLQKIVPSRIDVIELDAKFEVSTAFNALCETNPTALVSFVTTPSSGSWIGATPEMLVTVENNTFRTVALAGTQRYESGQNLRSVAWTQKDIEEQALVERYIISCFKMIRLREYEEHGPKTVVAGSLLHLKSEFKVDMLATNFPQLGTVMLKLLHPTSAVCGSPFPAALHFLKRHEKYERQFYTGYLGPVNVDGEVHLYVNLRCAQLIAGKAVLYAGAGITIDSNPAHEWEETEIKMLTLRKILSGSLL